MDEILDIFTRDGKYLGTKTRDECHQENPGYYHKPVWIWIIDGKGKFLLQKRSKLKKWFSECWDIPSAGHLNAGEEPIDGAVRETKEELGIDTKPEDYEFIWQYISDITWELGQVYLLRNNTKIENMKFQEEEVERAEWFSFDEFKKILFSDSFVPYEEEFKKQSIEFLKKYK